MTVLPRLLRSTMPAILIACTVAVVPAAAQDAARVPVQTLSDGLIAIMKGGKKLGLSGRVQQITPVIDRSFDLALMTRLAVGAPWTSASPAGCSPAASRSSPPPPRSASSSAGG